MRSLDVKKRASKIISHPLTEEKTLQDFPDVDKYLSEKFPDVDLSSISLYIVNPKVLEKEGWPGIGGCYIRQLKTIFVKREIHAGQKKSKGKFAKAMEKHCHMETEVEDVVIHEMIHGISNLIDRSSSQFMHMEEEFVYTNCIDFYKAKGMTEDEIVDNNFLPFCVQDVLQSKEFNNILAQCGITIFTVEETKALNFILGVHAEEIVPMIKEAAQEKAHRMIDLYKKYGAQTKTSETPVADATSLRFSALDI